MNYNGLDNLNENQDYDIFLINKETQSDLIKDSKAYHIYEIGQDRGNYLIYNIENLSVRRAVSSLVSGEEFLKVRRTAVRIQRG